MKVRLYSVFDAKLAIFNQPYPDLKDASALRRFSDDVNNNTPKNPLNKHPQDYSLFYIGDYDDETGELIPSLPKALGTGSSVFKEENQLPVNFANSIKQSMIN